jgi:hypothetical protein
VARLRAGPQDGSGAGRADAGPAAQCKVARRSRASEVVEKAATAAPLRARPSAPPHASVGPTARVRQRRPRGSRGGADQRAGPGANHRAVAATRKGGAGGRGGGGAPHPPAGLQLPRRSTARVRRAVGTPRASVGSRISVGPAVRFCAIDLIEVMRPRVAAGQNKWWRRVIFCLKNGNGKFKQIPLRFFS